MLATLMVVVALLAVVLGTTASGWLHDRRDRALSTADNHERSAANYAASASVYPDMRRYEAWHLHQRDVFLQAARRPWLPLPQSSEFPPPGYRPSLPDARAESPTSPGRDATSR